MVPRLHVVTSREVLVRKEVRTLLLAVLDAGEVALHLRAHGNNGRLLLELARGVRADRPRGSLLVNDRVDVARIVGAGVHLPEAGLTPAQARPILGSGPLLGRSLHTETGLDEGTRDLDYVFYGHVFETRSKPGVPPRGIAGLASFVRRAASAGVPVVAIGGIGADRVREVLDAGAYGVAAMSGIWDEPDPGGAAAAYLMEIAKGVECNCS
ncbi:MAG: thiamine phosphate synthase [Gemmatimonadetes bacterium]|nr:thiamine phosphate synthase [Gemmatimonadota bacterium]